MFKLFKRNKAVATEESIADLTSSPAEPIPSEDPDWDYAADIELPEPANTYEEITQLVIDQGWLPEGQYEPFSTWLQEEMDELGVYFARNSQVVNEKGDVRDAYIYGALDADEEITYDPEDIADSKRLLWAEIQ